MAWRRYRLDGSVEPVSSPVGRLFEPVGKESSERLRKKNNFILKFRGRFKAQIGPPTDPPDWVSTYISARSPIHSKSNPNNSTILFLYLCMALPRQLCRIARLSTQTSIPFVRRIAISQQARYNSRLRLMC